MLAVLLVILLISLLFSVTIAYTNSLFKPSASIHRKFQLHSVEVDSNTDFGTDASFKAPSDEIDRRRNFAVGMNSALCSTSAY